jgi:hypothetical protein
MEDRSSNFGSVRRHIGMKLNLGAKLVRKSGMALFVLTFGSALAFGETIPLNVCNDLALCSPGTTVATVTKTSTGTDTVLISESAASGYFLVDTGLFGFNSDTTFKIGTVTGTIAGGGTTTAFTTDTNRNEDGFGSFDYTINEQNASTHITDISFTVTCATACTTSNFDQPSTNGVDFASHLLLASSTTGLTGFGGSSAPVPETGSIMLFGSSLLAAGAWVRRRLGGNPA